MLRSAFVFLSWTVLSSFALGVDEQTSSTIDVADQTSSTIDVAEPFRYELHNTNIFPWITGERQGEIPDEEGAMAQALQHFLMSSHTSIDLAAYGIQHQEWLFQSLGDLVRQRIRIRAVVDQLRGQLGEWIPRNFTYGDTARLPDILKQQVMPDVGKNDKPRAGTIMHNKFVVVDHKAVWLGSTNFSSTCLGAEYNANTSIIVYSSELAEIYAGEFQQMYGGHLFSIYKRPRSRPMMIRYSDDTEVAAYFSPQDDPIEEAILPFIRNASTTLDVAMFFLTDVRIEEALAAAAKRGVKVRIIGDALAAAHPSSRYLELQQNGVHVRIENWGGKMHMKAAIADGRDVVTGSMNWSRSGSDANDENTLVVHNNERLASELGDYFERLWNTLNTRISRVDSRHHGPRAEGHDSINSCFDGIDNDHDGAIDQADSGCR